jgi:hypothetical protein
MKASKSFKYVLVCILLLVLSNCLYAATRQEIASALASARRDLRISIAMEERITSELTKLNNSGAVSEGIIEDYEYYLSLVKAMVAENRKIVAELEALNAMYNVRKASDRSAHRDDREKMVNPTIPEEQLVDEVTMLERQLDGSLAKFDEMLLKELDLILTKSSERMQDLSDEAESAVQRLREKGIEIDADVEEESAESGQESREEQKKAATEEDTTGTGKETQPEEGRDGAAFKGKGKSGEEGKDDADFKERDTFRKGAEGSRSHPRNRYDPEYDDIVARQLREAAEEESDPVLREKLWKEYEQYKENTGK